MGVQFEGQILEIFQVWIWEESRVQLCIGRKNLWLGTLLIWEDLTLEGAQRQREGPEVDQVVVSTECWSGVWIKQRGQKNELGGGDLNLKEDQM